eukprot:TRINITY_DN23167_c0_g1_i3.p1 TRINITY_DN23167_c0_g1~~TRINITY_DN23167_c0_g1_i3.p1  ORF type:complete len:1287 (+),score=197.43 TRINITY_DN23167_c0_g1_i3:74-3934(+)
MDSAGPFSKFLFLWLQPTMRTGFRRALQDSDAVQLPQRLNCAVIRREFQERIAKEHSWAESRSKQPRLLRLLVSMTWGPLGRATLYQLIVVACKFSSVVLLRLVVQTALQKGQGDLMSGVLAAFGLFALNVVEGILSSQATFQLQLGIYVWIMTFAQAVLWKGTKLHPAVQEQNRRGALVTLALSDLTRVVEMANILMLGVGAPFMLIFAFVSLVLLLGPLVLFAVLVCVLVFMLIKKIGDKSGSSFRGKMMWQGQRVSVLNEMLQSVRFTKYYTMESHYAAQMMQHRSKEEHQLKVMKMALALMWPSASLVPTFTVLVAFVMYVSIHGNLPPAEDTMAVLAIARFLFVPFAFFGAFLSAINMLLSATGRMAKLLLQPEISRVSLDDGDSEPVAVHVHGNFSWSLPASPNPPTLSGLALDVPRGELWVVVGSLGSGKSSLLAAILGYMTADSQGKRDDKQCSVKISGPSCAYVSQIPVVINATLRENVTFGFTSSLSTEQMEARYHAALEAAALGPDLEVLPAGDQTEIGEKGITLSGGQKARVAVARAVMASHPGGIVLLDDPLAAVDAHVGAHLFDKCIIGALAGTTRILVTNQVHYLAHPEVSRILVMEGGVVVEQGTYTELTADLSKRSKRFSQMAASVGGEARSTDTNHSSKGISPADPSAPGKNQHGELVKKEHKAEGRVKTKAFKFFIQALGGIRVFVFLFFCSWFFHLSEVIPDFILVAWQEDTLQIAQNSYLALWTAVSLTIVLAMVFGRGIWVAYTLRASGKILRAVTSHVLHCPVGFFDQTPSGRIFNRLGEDQMICDFTCPLQLEVLCISIWQILDKVILAILAKPMIAAVFAVLAGAFVFLREVHRRSSREMIRWWMVTKSPVFNAFEEILSGANTIYAFGQDGYFLKRFDATLETNLSWLLAKDASNLWVDIRLFFLAAIVVGSIALLMVLTADLSLGLPALSSIALIYALDMGFHLRTLTFFLVQLEGSFASVERLQEFTEDLPQEAPTEMNKDQELIKSGWPGIGCELVFQDVCLRYLPHMPRALDNLSVSLHGREKVGLVGRTGSGKSTIMGALFRLVELESGQILLGGVDIAKVGLALLRKQITIVPQDPILFSGQLRKNIDPTGACDDAAICGVLRRCGLEEFAQSLQKGLDIAVEEGGTNFSVGERQMLCLARALLRDAAVLCLDEATANVDPVSDQKIQRVLEHELHDCLVLTIAHRLHTVLHSNRILVLERGRLAQIGSPRELLAQPGIFQQLADQAGVSLDDESIGKDTAPETKNQQERFLSL